MQQFYRRSTSKISRSRPLTSRGPISAAIAGLAALVATTGAHAQSDETSLPSIPDYFEEKAASLGGSVSQAPNETISTFTGKLSYNVTDILIPGNGGMDLVVGRSYNSIDDPMATIATWSDYEYSPAGLGWTMHMGRVIRGTNKALCSSSWTVASANPVLELPDGSRQVFYEQPFVDNNAWMTKDFWRAQCVGGTFTVYSPDGRSYRMTKVGHSFGAVASKQTAYYPERITDRNGNWFDLSYQFLGNGVLAMSQVATSDGRSVNFEYTDSKLSKIVDVSNSREWKYTVSAGSGSRNYLTDVKRPDGQSWKYSYSATPGIGSLSRVTYPGGGSIDYAYSHVDFLAGTPRHRQSTVVASKTSKTDAAGTLSGTWTYAYEVASDELPVTTSSGQVSHSYGVPPAVRSQVNVTTVTDPKGNATEHYHMGYHSVRQSPTAVGVYMGSSSSVENVLLGYQDFIISSQIDVVSQNYTTNSFNPTARVLRLNNHYRAGENFYITKSNFDGYGNPGTVVEKATNNSDRTYTRTTSLTYDINTSKWLLHQVASQKVSGEGQMHLTTWLRDSNGNVLSETAAGVMSTATYHPTGDLASKTNALGQATSYSNYLRGIAQKEEQPESVTILRTVDNAGNVTSETNGRGKTTSYTYDNLNRVTSIAHPVGAVTSVAWTPTTRTVQRGAMTDVVTMDGLGRTVRRQVSAPGETSVWVNYTRNILGELVHQSYPNGLMGTGYDYDALGRIVATITQNYSGSNLGSEIKLTNYGGLRSFSQGYGGRASSDFYRAYGDPDKRERVRLAAGELAPGNSLIVKADVSTPRNLLGQINSVSMGGKTRTYVYNNQYFLVSKTDPEIGITNFGRDAIGNMTSKSVGSGPATTYTYDNRNRLKSISYPSSEDSAVPNAAGVIHAYDKNDNLLSSVNGSVSRSYTYDDNDKLSSESLAVAGASQTLQYAYDTNEALSSVTYPSGNQVNYQPDAFGRARAALPYISSIKYHPNGVASEIKYANGTVSTMSLYSNQLPWEMKLAKGTNRFIHYFNAYDTAARLILVNDAGGSTYYRSYSYDKLDRIVSEVSVKGQRNYAYDNVGNLTSIQTPTGLNTYAYDASTGVLDGVTGELYRAFDYDLAGNVISNGYNTFGHDRANNMRCVDCGTAAQKLQNYDASNMRVQTLDNNGSTLYMHSKQGLLMQTLDANTRKEHIYLGDRLVAERRINVN
ncbi:RHS repeat domain-containing protein [Comamonas koreensis]|uniref:RHS repeat protein n=1 Tax=Comamonas koreensis TaxID=160825 RepID=A0AAW4XVK5_9BURK|nr:hypothetical protein [Comamonas koreensis]MCD2165549.1 hypothetical protein [Comamonas koreensis]